MRLTSLHISLPADQVPERPSDELAMKRWWEDTKPLRQKGWQWTDLPLVVVRQGLQALVDDQGQNMRGIGLAVSDLLYARPEGERTWGWTLPVSNGKTVTFHAEAFIADPEVEGPAVHMELVAESKADRARLRLMRALNKTAIIGKDTLTHLLDKVIRSPVRPKDTSTLMDISADALQAEMVRIDQVWPHETSIWQFFLVAGPLAMWLKGLNEQASITELTLRGLTSKTAPRPANAACKLTVTYT